MKRYLNRRETEQWIMLAELPEIIDDILSGWELTADEKKNMKTARTLARKAADSILHRMEMNTLKKLHNSAMGSKLAIVPKHSVQQYKAMVEREEKELGTWVGSEALATLAEYALGQCNHPCTCKDKANCVLLKAYLELDIPYFDENPEDGVCPYEVTV